MYQHDNPIKSAIVELLTQFGRTNEALTYLNAFAGTDMHRFAIIKIGGGVLETEANAIVKSIAFMQNIGLVPVLVHGGGAQIDKRLQAHGIEVKKKGGLRITDAQTIQHLRQIMYQESHKLADALEKHNVKTRTFQHGVFECDYLDRETFGYVGTPQIVHIERIAQAAQAGMIPIVTPLGESASGQMMNINADTATQALAQAIKPQKIVFLTPSGGIWNACGETITAINLATDYDDLISQPWIEGGMRIKLQEIYALLQTLPDNCSVSVTSANSLTRELFTHQGAGTLIRKGESLNVQSTLSKEDKIIITELLTQCFAQQLRFDYFDDLAVKEIIWSRSKRALALITKGIDGIAYLDKFAVTPQARGEGLGAALWAQIIKRHPRLYWRSRTDNPINNWYVSKADHMTRQKNWLVLSYGIVDKNILNTLRQDTIARPSSWQVTPLEDAS